jgi:transcriptional antiterminator NusG
MTSDRTSSVEQDNKPQASVSTDLKWFIVRTLTGQENKVQKTIRENIINLKLGQYFGEVVVPEESVVTNTVAGKKKTIKKKVFPGYVLIHMIMNERTWHLVNATDKVTGFIGGTKDKPAPISDDEARQMLGQVNETARRPRTSVNLSEGDTVKVIEGPFASFVGTIENVNEKGKIKVNVLIFGRPTPVELDYLQVEKVG